MIKAVIFDCFGVVIADVLERALAEIRTRDPQMAEEMADVISAANHGIIEVPEARGRIAAMMGLTAEEYHEQIVKGNQKDERLLAYILQLRNTYKTAMLSNVGKGSLEKRFVNGELERCFDVVVSSGDIGYAKPEPQAYEIVAERLGVRLDECFFTDDREEYVEAARRLGMQAVQYRSFDEFITEASKILD